MSSMFRSRLGALLAILVLYSSITLPALRMSLGDIDNKTNANKSAANYYSESSRPPKREMGVTTKDVDANNIESSNSSRSKSHEEDNGPRTENYIKGPKIAIYMTTSMSQIHRVFLRKCWPTALKRLQLVKQADLIVYTSDTEHDKEIASLGFRNVVFWRFKEAPYGKRQKQHGAVRAMIDPFLEKNQWFEGYEWIVRLNPDVLIRNDTWLLQMMANKSVDGILGKWRRDRFLTDFNAFRPQAVNVTALVEKFMTTSYRELNAESHIYPGFSHLIAAGRIAWIPNIEFPGGGARIGGGNCDVVHDHQFHQFCHASRKDNVTYMDVNVSLIGTAHELVK